jgi:ABC-2 type transport system ATP-binding protein
MEVSQYRRTMNAQIAVSHLSKFYEVHQKDPGFRGSLRAFFRRRYETVRAVEDLSFEIHEGEVVGFLGPNGAGKTTALKVLSGLLYPTEGEVTVCGFRPFERHPNFLRQITLVMGQKNQLIWDLPASESFLVNRSVYDLSHTDYRDSMRELTDLLDLGPVLNKQVRKLSLGERMKCELAAALLHRPRVLFLDEPTIGLDVTMQARVREFLSEYNRRHGATILLTSHYMADVVALCRRVFVIDHGRLVYDGDLEALVERISPVKYIRLVTRRPIEADELSPFGEVRSLEAVKATLAVPREQTSTVAAQLFQLFPIEDITIEDPEVEEIIGRIFTEKLLSK